MTPVHWAVISTGRPHTVPRLQPQLPAGAVWYVGYADEVAAYRAAGAPQIVVGGALCAARNRALADAFAGHRPCLQLSDDLQRLWEVCVYPDGTVHREPRTLSEVVDLLWQALSVSPVYLAGVAPTANAYFYSARRPLSGTHFCVGDLCLVRPCPLRFDEGLTLKEDYDYTAQHLRRYGGVVRLNMLLAEFTHRTNAGGVVTYRTAAREEEAIAYLQRKWGAVIARHPTRPHEVVLRWRPARAASRQESRETV